MPTYHYRCADCAHEFDIVQKFSEDTLTVCPNCEGAIRRVIGPVGVVFKGSGWYITDSRKTGSGSPDTKSESSAKKSDDGAADSKSESKSVDSESKRDGKGDGKKESTSEPKSEGKVAAAV